MRRAAFLIFCFLFLCGIQELFAVRANPEPFEYRQSDNTLLNVRMRGDEKVNWALTSDDYTLMRNNTGDFVYAISDGKGGIKPSDMLAHNPSDRSQREREFLSGLEKKLFFSDQQIAYMLQLWDIQDDFASRKSLITNTDSEGVETYKMVVILMAYQDVAFETSSEDINNLFNQVGYSANGHQGSVHDYFLASSLGRLNVEATVLGPYTADNNMAYYGENSSTSNNIRVRELIEEAVVKANPDVDFSQYTNGEGSYVSCVYVIYAGYAESTGGNDPNTIWPHRSMLIQPYEVDGVYVRDYACSSEKNGTPYYPEALCIGTICHEFSHVLGQADYYDTNYEEDGSFADHGSWDIMCSGNYNNGGKCPPLWNALERNVRGYVDIEELSEPGNNTLPPLHTESKAYKMTITDNEYFLLENRQQVGWDTYLPGHGMLIYHVDESVAGWNYNCANCVANDPGVDLEEASGYSGSGAPFPGTSNNTSFTDNTTPNSLTKSGMPINRPITQITENTTTKNIHFIYGAEDDTRPVVNTVATDVLSDSVTVEVEIVNASSLAIIERGVCYSDTTDTPTIDHLKVVSTSSTADFNVGIPNLMPATEYYVRAYAKTADKVGYGEVIKVKTQCVAYEDLPYVTGFEEGDNSLECWENECGTFVSNKWTVREQTSEQEGINTAAEGSRWAFIRSDWMQGTQMTKLVTPPINVSYVNQVGLKFNYAQQSRQGKQDKLAVYYKTGIDQEWILLEEYTANVTQWTEETLTIPANTNTLYIAFQATLKGGYGVCLDDVEVYEADLTAFPQLQAVTYSNLIDSSAVVSSRLLDNGNNPVNTLGICYATHPEPTLDDEVITVSVTEDLYSVDLSGLEPNTTYYVRAFAENISHRTYSEQTEFTTLCSRVDEYPYVLETGSSDISCVDVQEGWSQDTETFRFESDNDNYSSMLVLPLFDLSNREEMKLTFKRQQPLTNSLCDTLKVMYKSNVEQPWTELAVFGASEEYHSDTVELVGASEEYHIAFLGISGTSHINLKEIQVHAVLQIPVVETNAPSLITYNEIAVAGNVTYGGLTDVTARGICWSLEGIPSSEDNVMNMGAGTGEFSGSITNAEENTTYYIRAFATNSFGTAYGQLQQITTPYVPIFNNEIYADQSVCQSTLPNDLTGSEPTGGNGEYEYLWILSTDGQNWIESNLGSLATKKDLEMRLLSTTTYFRRIVYSGHVTDTSNMVTITINELSRGGNAFSLVTNVEAGSPYRVELRAYLGDILYWERQAPGYNWQTVDNSADSVYLTDYPDIEGEWFYRAVVQNGGCEPATSGTDKVTVSSVGLENINTATENIKIVPNPSNGVIRLVSDTDIYGKICVDVIDMQSRVVKRIDGFNLKKGENVLDLSEMTSGSYVLRLYSDNWKWEGIVVIQR